MATGDTGLGDSVLAGLTGVERLKALAGLSN